MKKKIIGIMLLLIFLLSLAACADTDIVGTESTHSFEQVLVAMKDNVQKDDKNSGWALTSPDGSARFIWSKDFSSSTAHDVMLEFDAKPFLDAGLDANKLPAGMLVEDKILVGSELGDEKINYNGDPSPLESYQKIVEMKRDRIKYHKDLDHFGVDIGNGNVFEWAKTMSTNDKDIVFVLNPKMFIDAGVNPEAIDGWLFAKVKTMNENGRPIEVDKLLKPFSIQ